MLEVVCGLTGSGEVEGTGFGHRDRVPSASVHAIKFCVGEKTRCETKAKDVEGAYLQPQRVNRNQLLLRGDNSLEQHRTCCSGPDKDACRGG